MTSSARTQTSRTCSASCCAGAHFVEAGGRVQAGEAGVCCKGWLRQAGGPALQEKAGGLPAAAYWAALRGRHLDAMPCAVLAEVSGPSALTSLMLCKWNIHSWRWGPLLGLGAALSCGLLAVPS
jgi:hypothetical protein